MSRIPCVDIYPNIIASVIRANALDAILNGEGLEKPLVPKNVTDATLGLVVAGGDLHDFELNAEARSRAQRCTDLALLFDRGAWAVENLGRVDQKRYFTDYFARNTEFGKLPVVIRLFVTGVEDQLRRRVAFMGWMHTGRQYWIAVPSDDYKRWPGRAEITR